MHTVTRSRDTLRESHAQLYYAVHNLDFASLHLGRGVAPYCSYKKYFIVHKCLKYFLQEQHGLVPTRKKTGIASCLVYVIYLVFKPSARFFISRAFSITLLVISAPPRIRASSMTDCSLSSFVICVVVILFTASFFIS